MNKKLLVTAVVLALGLSSTTWADDTVSSDNGGTPANQGSAAVTVSDSGKGNDLSDNTTSTNSTTNTSESYMSYNSSIYSYIVNNYGIQVSDSFNCNYLCSCLNTATDNSNS